MAAVIGLSIDDGHHFSKRAVERVTMVAGVGIEGDVHAGPLVQHRSRVRVDPNQPNLRQVHLIDDAVFAVAASAGFEIDHGDLGENVTVSGLDVHGLAVGTMLRLAIRRSSPSPGCATRAVRSTACGRACSTCCAVRTAATSFAGPGSWASSCAAARCASVTR